MRGKIVQLAGLLALGGLISIATIAAVVAATNRLKQNGVLQPEVALPLLLVAGLIALVAALAILVGTFSIFGLSNRNAAFGVPEGTLQAVIAMMIIMIFAITSLYLNASLKETTYTSTGINQAQLDAIPADEIRSIRTETVDGVTGYTVKRTVQNVVSEDFAKQLLTTLSTLVVAIVGFYFGAKSVETGVAAASSPPVNSDVPEISGQPKAGATLSVEPGAWTGSPPPTYSYRWQRCASEGECVDIAGAVGKSYKVTQDDVGNRIRVIVTATNSAGVTSANSVATEVISDE
jgi:hypothetical protein